ncbi:MAG: hypothetical protein ACRDLM_10835 [Gaiellaceae bacterium]
MSISVSSLRLTFSSELHWRYFSSCSFAVTGARSGACVQGVVVASYRLKPNPELGGSGARFPSDGVAVELYRSPSQQAYVAGPALPLRLADFHTVGRGIHQRGEQRQLAFRANSVNYWAIAWIGARSTHPERDDLGAVVGSIRVVQSAATPPRLPGHALLVDRPGVRLYGPPLRAGVACPRLLPLAANALATVKRAVELAMPPYERTLKLDGRNPIVKVAPASRSVDSYQAGGCGRAAWQRSVVASVLLPHVEKFSASMSQHTFAVGRVRQGWVLWGYIH